MVRSGAWIAPGLRHGFFGRTGGVSRDRFATLNLAGHNDDDPAAVAENWRRAIAEIGPARTIVRLHQVHGTEIHLLDGRYDGARLTGDGAIATIPGITVGVFTADCVPLLMIDPQQRIAGAFHAGWRGTLAGIAASAVKLMVAAGANRDRMRALIGPAIGQCCYEVDEELGVRFGQRYRFASACLRPGKPGKLMLDLRGVINAQLIEAGMNCASIELVGPCTRCAADRFFSRRAAQGPCGLQFSFVGFDDGSSA